MKAELKEIAVIFGCFGWLLSVIGFGLFFFGRNIKLIHCADTPNEISELKRGPVNSAIPENKR